MRYKLRNVNSLKVIFSLSNVLDKNASSLDLNHDLRLGLENSI